MSKYSDLNQPTKAWKQSHCSLSEFSKGRGICNPFTNRVNEASVRLALFTIEGAFTCLSCLSEKKIGLFRLMTLKADMAVSTCLI